MKFRVYEEKEATEEPVVTLRLRIYYDDGAELSAADSDGNILPCGHLITLPLDGTVKRLEAVNPDLGFQLDHRGRIKLAEED